MKNTGSKIRIKDIARLAGVSEGTVDRVIHNRGEVSMKSCEAVKKVLAEMNYSPNILARSLASKKQYIFACLIPQHEVGDYWETVEIGFDQAYEDFSQYNVMVTKYYFNQFDVNSFQGIANQVVEENPDAVIIAPIFRNETIGFAERLHALNIPFSFIDSMIENTGFLTYYGQNSFLSGYIAGKLLLSELEENSQVIVIRTKRKGAASNQTLSRNEGFLHYIKANSLDKIQLINAEIQDGDEENNLEILRQIFQENNHVKAAITFNSKVYRLAGYLSELGKADVKLIGYDLLEQNVEYLKQDVVSYLIAQRPDKQAFLSVRDLCRELIFHQEVKAVNYVPVDVLMKENIEDYIVFQE
ncbi:MAG: substrate-binding domain-containing protein [Paludibacter sp.]|nr:substrate-binding domain-containing protein [Paludibacter sp.]